MGVFGYFVQRLLINPVLKHERTSQLLITFGLGLAIQNGALALWGPDISFVQSFAGYRTFEILGVRIGISAAIAIIGAAMVIGLFFLFLNKTRLGTAIRAVAQQSDSALLSGIDVNKIYGLAFAIGSAMVGVAAVLIIPIYDISPLMGEQFGVIAFIVVVLGGLGNVKGAAIAGLFLGLMQNLFAIYVSNQLSVALLFLIFLVTLLFRPQGLFVRKLRVA
jgi:branched-chain amino acid transport system permease protein